METYVLYRSEKANQGLVFTSLRSTSSWIARDGYYVLQCMMHGVLVCVSKAMSTRQE